jgi:hypothetical protein
MSGVVGLVTLFLGALVLVGLDAISGHPEGYPYDFIAAVYGGTLAGVGFYFGRKAK